MDLSKQIDKIAAAYDTAYKKLDAWRTERDNAKKAFNERADKLTLEAANEENAKIVEEFARKSDEIRAELAEAVAIAEDAFKQEVKAFYAVDGNAIDEADMAAVESGVMTSDEVAEMVVKHSENPTMLRIIRKFAIEHNMKFETAIERALMLASKGGEKELKALERLKNSLHCAVNFATEECYSKELFLNTALKQTEYVKEAKRALLESKLFIDEDTRAELEKYAADQVENNNKKYDPHSVDYNWQ